MPYTVCWRCTCCFSTCSVQVQSLLFFLSQFLFLSGFYISCIHDCVQSVCFVWCVFSTLPSPFVSKRTHDLVPGTIGIYFLEDPDPAQDVRYRETYLYFERLGKFFPLLLASLLSSYPAIFAAGNAFVFALLFWSSIRSVQGTWNCNCEQFHSPSPRDQKLAFFAWQTYGISIPRDELYKKYPGCPRSSAIVSAEWIALSKRFFFGIFFLASCVSFVGALVDDPLSWVPFALLCAFALLPSIGFVVWVFRQHRSGKLHFCEARALDEAPQGKGSRVAPTASGQDYTHTHTHTHIHTLSCGSARTGFMCMEVCFVGQVWETPMTKRYTLLLFWINIICRDTHTHLVDGYVSIYVSNRFHFSEKEGVF